MECKVCFIETFQESDLITLSCGCKFCMECITSWISFHTTKHLQRKNLSIPCLSFSCPRNLDLDNIMTLFTSKYKEKLADILLKHHIVHSKDIMNCPSCDNSSFVSNRGICLGAYRCAECRNEFQLPNTATEVKAWLWILFFANRCPKCNIPFQKDAGCDHMTCSVCSHEFCYSCFGDHKDHTDTKCTVRYILRCLPVALLIILALYIINLYIPIFEWALFVPGKTIDFLNSIEEESYTYWIMCILIPNLAILMWFVFMFSMMRSRSEEYDDPDPNDKRWILSIISIVLLVIIVIIGLFYFLKGVILVWLIESLTIMIMGQNYYRFGEILRFFWSLFWKNLLVFIVIYPLTRLILLDPEPLTWNNLIGESLLLKTVLQNFLIFLYSVHASSKPDAFRFWWHVPTVLLLSSGYMILMECNFNIWTGFSFVLFYAALGGMAVYALKRHEENINLLRE